MENTPNGGTENQNAPSNLEKSGPDANNTVGQPGASIQQNAEQMAGKTADTLKAGVNQVGAQAEQAINQGINAVGQKTQETVNQGVAQVGQIGQASVEKIGGLVGQVLSPDKTLQNQPPVSQDEKVYAVIAYVPFLALISLIVKPDSAYVRLHSKQGLLLAIIFFFVGMLAAIVSLFGLLGQILAILLGFVPVGVLVVDVYSMYLAYSGYWWKIPVLGTIADVIPVEWMAKTSKENITGQMGVAKEDYDVRKDTLQKEQSENQTQQVVPAQGGTSGSTMGAASTSSNVIAQTPNNDVPPKTDAN